MDIPHTFVQKCDDDVHAEGKDLLRSMGNNEVGFTASIGIVQVDAVESSSNCCYSYEPCCTESNHAAISSPYCLVELVVARRHSRCFEVDNGD